MNINLLEDIYYRDVYISLYLKDYDELFCFEYIEDNKFFINKSIKREIQKIGNVELKDRYYDLESAYGYGGFYTNSDDKLFIDKAMKAYEKRCKEENIIAEFMRFHPFNDFAIKHNEFLEFNIYDRDVVIKDLSIDILKSYISKVRNTIKRSIEKVTIQKSKNIDKFIELYNQTMIKNSASDFYFFDKKYYQDILEIEDVELYEVVFEKETIAMGLFMFSDSLVHYHLSANSELSYKLNSNYALLHYVFTQAKGDRYFILGGGTTASTDDTLFKFKGKFSKETKPFYISGKVYNREIYDKYVKLWQQQSSEDIKYFLKYRLEIE